MNTRIIVILPFILFWTVSTIVESGWAASEQSVTGVSSKRPAVLEPSIHFLHLTSEDGLSQNQTEVVLQDRRGMMWIGTEDGLNRLIG